MTTPPKKQLAFYAGAQLEMALQRIAKAIDYEIAHLLRMAILETDCLKGIKPPDAGPVLMRLRLKEDQVEKVEALAAAAKISKSQALRVLCQLAIDKNRKLV